MRTIGFRDRSPLPGAYAGSGTYKPAAQRPSEAGGAGSIPGRCRLCVAFVSCTEVQLPLYSSSVTCFVCFSLRLMCHCSKGTRPEAAHAWRVSFAGLGPKQPYCLKPRTFCEYTFI